MTVRSLLICIALAVPGSFLQAHESARQMSEIATVWLNSLQDDQKAKAQFAFDDDQREDWHFIPKERKGLTLGEMKPQQRLLAYALLSTGLAEQGLLKAMSIMSLEEVLFEMESAEVAAEKKLEVRARRDPEKYHVCIFGQPSNEGIWGWSWEGHHLSLNFTVKDGLLVRASPSFLGSNPGEVMQGNLKGLRVLGVEEECGRALMQSLSEDQRKLALIADKAPRDIITEVERHIQPLQPAGLSAADMNVGQQAMLHRLIREYLERLRPDIAESAWVRLQEAGGIHFAWAGGWERGQPHYYRVQGRTFLLEYDNVQNGANHVHCVWREFEGDFGRDFLGEHHRLEHAR